MKYIRGRTNYRKLYLKKKKNYNLLFREIHWKNNFQFKIYNLLFREFNRKNNFQNFHSK